MLLAIEYMIACIILLYLYLLFFCQQLPAFQERRTLKQHFYMAFVRNGRCFFG